MKAKSTPVYMLYVIFVCLVGAAAVFGPAAFLQYHDRVSLGGVMLEEKEDAGQGYKYSVSPDEKLYVLANALNNRIIPQSDYFAAMRRNDGLSDVRTQSYAFQPVYNESEVNDDARAAALDALRGELGVLSELGVLPEVTFEPADSAYEIAMYSAIDILEPKLSATVWQVSFNGVIIRDGLVDCVFDAQTHKIYSISLRAERGWQEYEPDTIIGLWAEYAGVSEPGPYEHSGSLAESATYYQKYVINGVGGDKTIVTVGYYEGINEFFIRISDVF